MGIINEHFTLPGQDRPPQEFMTLRTQQGQINWLACLVCAINRVFNTVSVTTETLDAGEDASVRVVFDQENHSTDFEFEIPQGVQGETGPQGIQGEAGPQGPQGIQGETGPQGPQGDVNATGAYPQLNAGTSNYAYVSGSLVDGESEVVTFAERVSDHDGGVRVESLRGNTIRWNQLAAVTSASTTINGVTFTNNGDGSVTVNGSATAQTVFNTGLRVDSASGHKLLVKGCPAGGSTASTYRLKNGYGISADIGNGLIETSTNVYVVAQIIIASGYTANNLIFVPQIFDLTTIFGAGNEPSTVAEFEALFPEDYYPYDAGSLLSVNVEGIRSAGVIREIPAATYFPDGMRSAGSVYDEITSEKAVTRIGAVDLGTLNWFYESDNTFRTIYNGIKLHGALMCLPYAEYNGAISDMPDKTITASNTQTSLLLRVKDTNYTNAATFKAAMNGVMLYYELATLTETAIDPPLNMTYPVEAGGIESIVIPTGEQSAAPTFEIVNSYNASGIVNQALSVIAPVEGANASTNYAIGSYLVQGGNLCRVTSPIATGEAITPGANCAITTVMAEVVALSQSI